ncbi:unnamed protein product [Cyprideis torosa]|uniref:Elongation of very long chain fatty acids protein n=1 Tax=Cyprideis torosa TaxID=163714 RepID=A0A7R8ZJ86_9CRUS|nr:unnamed protein product [Cyprideis torosa]CAG0881697.1 unnamed protein product [Cyprideis torosa]
MHPASLPYRYHHVTVLLYTWYSFAEYIAPGRWFICMNYMVHSLMYSYYALKALKFKVPRWISMVITISQLSQMLVGCYVNYFAYNMKMTSDGCCTTFDNIKVSILMYASYFVLFARFFYINYLTDPTGKKGLKRD